MFDKKNYKNIKIVFKLDTHCHINRVIIEHMFEKVNFFGVQLTFLKHIKIYFLKCKKREKIKTNTAMFKS